MRAATLAALLVCGSAWAGDEVESPRFEVRAASVQAVPIDESRQGGGRFSAEARVSSADGAPDPHARFQAKAVVKATNASCGPRGDVIFANGFE